MTRSRAGLAGCLDMDRESVVLARGDGRRARTVQLGIPGGLSETAPRPSPDGKVLMWEVVDYEKTWSVCRMRIPRGDIRCRRVRAGADARVDWGRGRTLIAFTDHRVCRLSDRLECTRTLARLPRRLRDERHLRDVELSPDGRRLAVTEEFLYSSSTEMRVAVYDLRSGRRRELTRGHTDTGAGWSPDGRRIFFTRDAHVTAPAANVSAIDADIVAVPAGGGRVRRVVAGFEAAWAAR